jgi:predicted porin
VLFRSIGVRGADTFGVKGLSVSAFLNNEKGSTPGTLSTNNDVTGYHVGASYGIGAIRVGVETNSSQANTGHANTVQTIAATYAVSPNATLGLWKSESKIGLKSSTVKVDEI